MKFNRIILLFAALALFACEKQQPVLYMVGDSTMANKPDLEYPERGWGQLLPAYFNSSLVIENHAQNGRSTRSFIYEGRWDSVYKKLQSGDFVVIQFGHNDEVESKTGRYATPEEFQYNLRKFVTESQQKGAKPILCTSIARRNFVDSILIDTHGSYPSYLMAVAKEFNIPCIDMNEKSTKLLSSLGEEGSLPLFLQIPPGVYKKVPDGKIDNTHLSEKGATTMAGLFVEGIKEQYLELEKYLKNE